MGSLFKPAPFFLVLFLVSFGWQVENLSSVEASRPIPLTPQQQRNSKIFASLGLVCKCCDGAAGQEMEKCTTSWTGSCSNLQCLPWKFHH